MRSLFIISAAVLSCVPFQSCAAPLDDAGTIVLPATSTLYTKPKERDDQSHNMSAMFCPSPDWCVVASDELHGFHRLKVTREAGKTPALTYDAELDLGMPPKDFRDRHELGGDFKEFDLEAIASSGDQIYFFGSHGNKRKKGKVNPGAHVVAIASVADLEGKTVVPATWASLDPLFKADTVLGDRLNKQLQCGGLNIEGATILGDTAYIGVRIPSQGTDGAEPAAYVMATPLAGFATDSVATATRHTLPTDQPFLGIRSMETVGDSVLVITGDSGVSDLEGPDLQCEPGLNREDPTRPFQLRLWKPATGDNFAGEPLVTFDRLEVDGNVAKLEGIAADPGQPGAFFVVYDGDDTIHYIKDVKLDQ